MNITNTDSRGTIQQGRRVWSINNALVEEVSTNSNGSTGHLIVSYAVRAQNDMMLIELLRLNVNRNTIKRNQFGLPVCLCDIRPGMWIDTQFSPIMTKSIPPQTNALQIVVHRRMQHPQPPRPQPHPPSGLTMIDRIVNVDAINRFLVTGDPNDMNEQMRFVVTDETVILDRRGNRIALHTLHPGQLVKVTHADFQTMSIPPQTTAFQIRVV